MINSELTGKVIKDAMLVHTSSGPGLLESAYKDAFIIN
jgi:hypothetical protein